MWKILVVLVLLGVGAAALWVNAGDAEGPTIEISGPALLGQTGEIAVEVTAPKGALTGLSVTFVQGDSTTSLFQLTPETAATLTTAGDSVSLTRQARHARAQSRRSPGQRNGRAARVVRPAASYVDRDSRARGASDAAAARRAIAIQLHQSRRLRDGRLPCDPARRGIGRARRRSGI